MKELIPIIAVCGVGADLATLPLLACVVLLMTPVASPPPQLAWMGEPWMLAAAVAVLCAEIAVDTMMDRRIRFVRRAWPVIQHVLILVCSIIVVVALGSGLSVAQQAAALLAALVCTGVIKEGVVSQFRNVMAHAAGA